MKCIYHKTMILLLLMTNLPGISQDNHHKLVMTLDAAGNSGGYSLNSEYEFLNSDKYIVNTRLGFGYFPIYNTNFLSIPTGINLLTGKQNHHLEFGLGASYLKGLTFSRTYWLGTTTYYPTEALYFVPSVGYRYDKLSKGLIFKVYYSPLVAIHDFIHKDKIMNEVTKHAILTGTTTREEYFNLHYGDDFLPYAKNRFGNWGISVGYRF
jgi:hypothetical protein